MAAVTKEGAKTVAAAEGGGPAPRTAFLTGLWFLGYTLLSYLASSSYSIFNNISYIRGYDQGTNIWVLWNVLEKLSRGELFSLYDSPQCYPLSDSLLFFETSLTSALTALPVYLCGFDQYSSFVFLIHSSFLLAPIGAYFLARQLGASVNAAGIAGLVYGFSSYHLANNAYTPYAIIQWVPFCLLYIHRYFEGGGRRELWLAALFYLLQIGIGGYFLMFTSLSLLVVLAFLIVEKGCWKKRKFYMDIWPVLAVIALGGILIYLPVLNFHSLHELSRPLSAQIKYSARLCDYFTAISFPTHVALKKMLELPGQDGLNPGYVPLLLALSAALGLSARKSAGGGFKLRVQDALLILLFFAGLLATRYDESAVASLKEHFPLIRKALQRATYIPLFQPSKLIWGLLVFLFFLRIFAIGRLSVLRREAPVFFLYLLLALLCFVISLGPLFTLVGEADVLAVNLSTLLVDYILPGFKGLRVTGRLSGFVPVGIGICAAIGFDFWLSRMRTPAGRRIFSAFVLLALLAEFMPWNKFSLPADTPRSPEDPVYVWLKDRPQAPLLELPDPLGYQYRRGTFTDGYYTHGKPMLNGFGSYEWKGILKLKFLGQSPNELYYLALAAFGPRYLVIFNSHEGYWTEKMPERWGGYTLALQSDQYKVYENPDMKGYHPPPEDIHRQFSFFYEHTDTGTLRILIVLNSPKQYYVSTERMVYDLKVRWNSDRPEALLRIRIPPTLWHHGILPLGDKERPVACTEFSVLHSQEFPIDTLADPVGVELKGDRYEIRHFPYPTTTIVFND
ncbi:MAG: hypothetical protein HQL31_02125 [Planctomycetes bacterium]|nr:hypothetical protein [Planctomycetota bacterium]